MRSLLLFFFFYIEWFGMHDKYGSVLPVEETSVVHLISNNHNVFQRPIIEFYNSTLLFDNIKFFNDVKLPAMLGNSTSLILLNNFWLIIEDAICKNVVK